MSVPKVERNELKLVQPSFDSPVTGLIIELEKLRDKTLSGSTHPQVFFQIKHIFHMLESIGSARIEGNNTTIVEYIETKLDQKNIVPQSIQEIQNIENAMMFIDENIEDVNINRIFISELHKRIVEGLTPAPTGEGDKTPGAYREINVKINGTAHIPPDSLMVKEYMDELFEFINKKDDRKYDLLKVAIAHHRFVWIHPFTNGNGRSVRLFTYAMLVKQGFKVSQGRIINPTAIFCNNRNDYYNYLSVADKGTEQGMLAWCQYVLSGLKKEIEKIDKLTNYDYLKNEILNPVIMYSLEREYITEQESKILKRVIEKQVVQALDLAEFFPKKCSAEISRQIRRLIEKQMLIPEREKKRKYVIRFDNNFLLRGVIKVLGEKGFLPLKE